MVKKIATNVIAMGQRKGPFLNIEIPARCRILILPENNNGTTVAQQIEFIDESAISNLRDFLTELLND